MANSIIWASTPDLLSALPLTQGFKPVFEWDNEARKFTTTQQKKQGLPVWEAEALMQTGWGAKLEAVSVRVAATSCPNIVPDPSKVAAMLAPAAASSAPASAATAGLRTSKHAG